MPDVQEVFRLATQKVRPDPGALERQHRGQRRHVARKKIAVYALVAAFVIAGMVAGISALRSGDGGTQIPGSPPTPTATPIPSVREGVLAPGAYVIRTLDRDFNASHRITIDVPEGYRGLGGVAVLKSGLEETGVGVWVAGGAFADACKWRGTQSAISSAEDLVAALAGQKALRPSTPTDVTVDGFTGTYMELTTPGQTKLGRCDEGQVQVLLDTGGGTRYRNNPGQHDRLWILDVDGVPLVIDAPLGADASAQDRAEVVQMVESIRIDG
jgi:hypothetical protein